MSVDEMLAAIDRGEITDAKTVTALLLYARRMRRRDDRAPRSSCAAACRASASATPLIDAARACGVAGWVRNRRDGTVEALVQGEPRAVERAIAWCGAVRRRRASTAVDVDRGSRAPRARLPFAATDGLSRYAAFRRTRRRLRRAAASRTPKMSFHAAYDDAAQSGSTSTSPMPIVTRPKPSSTKRGRGVDERAAACSARIRSSSRRTPRAAAPARTARGTART